MTKFQFDSAREAEAARAFLVTVAVGRERHFDAGEELTELVRSDNLEPVGLIQARRDKPDPATYLGSGKIEEIKMLAKGARADCIVLMRRFRLHSNEISPTSPSFPFSIAPN